MADGRMAFAVASLVGPSERQATRIRLHAYQLALLVDRTIPAIPATADGLRLQTACQLRAQSDPCWTSKGGVTRSSLPSRLPSRFRPPLSSNIERPRRWLQD
jgi:hypothetical protein